MKRSFLKPAAAAMFGLALAAPAVPALAGFTCTLVQCESGGGMAKDGICVGGVYGGQRIVG